MFDEEYEVPVKKSIVKSFIFLAWNIELLGVEYIPDVEMLNRLFFWPRIENYWMLSIGNLKVAG